MQIFQKIKIDYQYFVKDTPGLRFVNHYERSKTSKKLWLRIVEISLGIVFVIISILFGLTPILPGFVFFLFALILFASNSKFVALQLDKFELWLRKKFHKH